MIDKKEIKKQIFEKCIPLINEKGFNSLGVKEITDTAGMSKGSFYNYFPSKEKFGVELIDYYNIKTEKALRSILFVPGLSYREKFINVYLYFKDIYDTQGIKGVEGILGTFSVELSVVSPEIKDAVDRAYNAIKSVFEEAVEAGQKNGEIYIYLDKTDISEFLLISWYGAILRMRASGNFAPFKLCHDFVINTVFINDIDKTSSNDQKNSTE
ncbi:MAG TPA: TetR/AcrR family transcriptional regulator [Spirochaetota bacterium]|nr:TetR/AcrR family transcriptional regulator [Spirochaetota bacterium]